MAQSLQFSVQGLGLRASSYGLGFRVKDLGVRLLDSWCRVQGQVFKFPGLRIRF